MSSDVEHELENTNSLDLGAVARALLRLSSVDAPRTRFMALVGDVLLAHTRAASVDLCLRDDAHFYCVCASRHSVGNDADADVTVAWCDGSEPGRCAAALRGELTCVGPLVSRPPDRFEARDAGSEAASLQPFSGAASEKGLLLVQGDAADLLALESEDLYASLAEVVGEAVALHARLRRSHAREEESRVLHRIFRLVSNVDLSADAVLERVVGLLPEAFAHPDRVAARIVIDGRQYVSKAEWPDAPAVSRELRVGGEVRGAVELTFETRDVEEPMSDTHAGRLLSETARHVAALVARMDHADELSHKQMERHSERLATIGTLASNLAHDLNDPLSTVSGFAELLKKEDGLSERGRIDLERISTASKHAQEIVHCLLLLARRSSAGYRIVNMNGVVDDAIALVEHRCRERDVEVIRELAVDLPDVQGDPVQLCQVVINLMRNAVHAMPEGGQLTLTTRPDERGVSLAIRDTGSGMSDEVRARIFDPFFTTKNASDGTGLGLAIVQDIVTLHGGKVEVESSNASGTCMIVRLPVHPGGRW